MRRERAPGPAAAAPALRARPQLSGARLSSPAACWRFLYAPIATLMIFSFNDNKVMRLPFGDWNAAVVREGLLQPAAAGGGGEQPDRGGVRARHLPRHRHPDGAGAEPLRLPRQDRVPPLRDPADHAAGHHHGRLDAELLLAARRGVEPRHRDPGPRHRVRRHRYHQRLRQGWNASTGASSRPRPISARPRSARSGRSRCPTSAPRSSARRCWSSPSPSTRYP